MITVRALFWPRIRPTAKDQTRARALRASGHSRRQIADEIRVGMSTVDRWLRTEHGTASGAPEPGPVPVARRKVRQ